MFLNLTRMHTRRPLVSLSTQRSTQLDGSRVESGPQIYANSQISPQMCAVSGGDKLCIGALLGRGANVLARDVDGWSALHYAASCDRKVSIEMLLRNGATPALLMKDTFGMTPFQLASDPKIKRLLQHATRASKKAGLS